MNTEADKPEKRKKKPLLTILTAIAIVVFALLLLCIIPGGSNVYGLVLPKPKTRPIVSTLEPIGFQKISPPVGGGPSRVVFELPTVITVPVPTPFPRPERKTPGSGPGLTGEPRLMDFGDAPDIPYGGNFPSLRASLGARHKFQPFILGYKSDTEDDSHQVDQDSPNPAIGGDDGWDWKEVTITNYDWPEDQPMYLNVLDDKDNNLRWDVEKLPEEHVVIDQQFFVPRGATIKYALPEPVSGNWIRFTLTNIPLGALYDGSWSEPFEYGETEDYIRRDTVPYEPPPPFHTTFWSVHIPVFTHWQVFTHLWHRSASGPGIPIEVPPWRPGPGIPIEVPPWRPGGIDVPTFNPKKFTPVIDRARNAVVGLHTTEFHESGATKFVPLDNPYDAPLVPGTPLWEAEYENGQIVRLHAIVSVHGVNRTDRIPVVPLEPPRPPVPAPPTSVPPRATYPDYNLTGTHEENVHSENYTNEITIRHNENDTKYYYPDGTEFKDYEVYDIPRPLLLRFQLPERGVDGEPAPFSRILRVITSPISPVLQLFTENIRQTLLLQYRLATRPQPMIVRQPVEVPVQVPVIIERPAPPQPIPPQPPAVVTPKYIVTGEGAFTSDNKVTIRYEVTNGPVDILLVPINRFGQEIVVPEKSLITVLSRVSGKGIISKILPQISGAVAFYVKMVDSAGKQVAITTNTVSYFQVGGVTPAPPAAALSITTTSLPNGTVGVAYSATLAATGGTTPYSWSVSAGSLPAGLSLNSTTGEISGDPMFTGSRTFTITVTDNVSATASREFTITVN
jgi:hypothetical protein